MRPWQGTMIALARSPRVSGFMHRNAAASALARRFVGGGDLAVAMATAQDLRQRGISVSLFYLGEYVSDPEIVRRAVEQKTAAIEALAQADLDIHVSVDPTRIGHAIDADLGRRNAFAIGEAWRPYAIRRVGESPRNARLILQSLARG